MTWNLDPPPGFQGLHAEKPVTMYQRHLPHWRQPGATYFVTFRLGDSLPQAKLDELRIFREQWERKNPLPRTEEQLEEVWNETFRRVEESLDKGLGSCRLRDRQAGNIVTDSLHHFDNERYELGCYVVMPNHCHIIVRPLEEDDEALSRITHSWKRHTSQEINKLFRLKGPLWQEESYDRIVRDEEHLWTTIQYIGRNPLVAGLPLDTCPPWIRPSWEELGWRFDDGS